MPNRPPVPCPQCGRLLINSGDCPAHPRKRPDKRKSAAARGYGRDWMVNVRNPYITNHPWCADPYSVHQGVLVPAQMVDHILPKPAGTDDPSNLQSLCYKCHQIKGYRDGTRGRGVQN